MFVKEKLTIAPELDNLVQKLRASFKATQEGPKIKATKTLEGLALVYERFRSSIEYHEEHLLRKNAIKRIIKRLLFYHRDYEKVAQLLVDDLIRAGYFKNETILESAVLRIKIILEKYQVIFDQIGERPFQERPKLQNWLLGIIACEVEDLLVPSAPQEALIEFATPILTSDLDWEGTKLTQSEKDLQIYIVMNRVLYKADQQMLYYRVFKKMYPDWFKTPTLDLVNSIAVNFEKVKNSIETQAGNPLNDVMSRKLRRYAMIFWVLNDVIVENLGQIEKLVTDPFKFEEQIKAKCEGRYRSFGSKLRRSFIRSVIYIFFTKTILAFLLELPYDLYLRGEVFWFPFITNIVFHPFLMLIIGASVKVPSAKNTTEIVNSVFKIAYQEKKASILYKSSRVIVHHPVLNSIFNVFYTLAFLVSFGGIVYLLYWVGFNWIGGLLFIFFLTAVSFFGIRLRYGMRELIVLPKEGNLFTTLIDFFSIPFIQAGKWVANKLPKINVIVFVLDRIIEAPLKSLIPVLDHWISYVKDKKDEIY